MSALVLIVVFYPIALVLWLVLGCLQAAARPMPPHVPADVDLAQCLATVRAIDEDGRRCAHERRIDQREDGGMLWCWDCREPVTR